MSKKESLYETSEQKEMMKADFVAKLSHDVRTSMNIILGMTAIADSHLENKERVSDCLHKINAAGRQLLIMMNAVFDLEKMEAGTLELMEEELNLHKVIDSLLEIMQPQINEKKHKIVVSKENLRHDAIIGDNQHLMQIFVNVLGNAIQYTKSGGEICLTVSEKEIISPHLGCFEFIFEDNGIGMSKEFIEHIFEPRTQVMLSDGLKSQSKGVGLCIADYMAKLMNGSIKIESEEGKGSRVTVTLYLHLHLREDEDLAFGDSARFFGKRALIAEDNEINAEIVKEILTEIGLSVDCVENGRKALDILIDSEPEQYSIVFMDIQMPDMDGYEASRRIRASKRKDLKKIPIIAITADAFAEHVRAAKKAGMNQHIAKPLDAKQIVEVLQKWL